MPTMVSPNNTPVVVNGNTYTPAYAGEPMPAPQSDVVGLQALGWINASLMTQMAAVVPVARSIPLVDVAGNLAANATYAGVYPPKNVEDAIAAIFAKLATL